MDWGTEVSIMGGGRHGTRVMASAAAKPAHGDERPAKGRPISELGMSPDEARELRARLASFAREWDDPRMDVYDREA